MASLKEIKNPHGQTRWRVAFDDCARKDFRSRDEACRRLYLAEQERFDAMSPGEKEKSRDWTLRKLILFFIGKKVMDCENGKISPSSLKTIESVLLAIDPVSLAKQALKVLPSELEALPQLSSCYLHSAYLAFIRLRGTGRSPVPKVIIKDEKPLYIPAFENVEIMIDAAPVREKIALILASELGLRISEVLALRYSDIRGELLSVSRHITAFGVVDGLKADIQRLLWLPEKLLPLLDRQKFGTHEFLIAGKNGEHLALSYSRNGPMKRLLKQYQIEKFHNLRHFAAVNMLTDGEDLSFVSEVLGHKNVKTTKDTYGRFSTRVLKRKKTA